MLGGCQGNSADAQRIAELEAQVEQLQEAQDGSEPAADPTAADPADDAATDDAPSASAPAPDTAVTKNYPDVSKFESRVADLEKTCSSVKVGKDADANYRAYLDVKAELDALDDEMDLYDEQQEAAARSGKIEYNDYIQIETALDVLGDRLDRAEDSMQYKLGIYDD